jgi:hypothetical protein
MEIDHDKIDEAVLALLWLTLHDVYRAWKGFDWATMGTVNLARSRRSWCRHTHHVSPSQLTKVTPVT